MSGPSVSRKTYALTFGALLGLTVLTTVLGYLDLGVWTIILAVAIATVKAILIASFFMHALFEGKLVRVAIAGGVVWFLIMVSLTSMDYVTRGWLPFPGK